MYLFKIREVKIEDIANLKRWSNWHYDRNPNFTFTAHLTIIINFIFYISVIWANFDHYFVLKYPSRKTRQSISTKYFLEKEQQHQSMKLLGHFVATYETPIQLLIRTIITSHKC